MIAKGGYDVDASSTSLERHERGIHVGPYGGAGATDPGLASACCRFGETGLRRRWLEYGAARHWRPVHDQAELQSLEHLTAHQRA